ncbi:sensor histidine kinase [Cognatilysobacter tabacisoli]|uniref:sensor histidine kinase n=1 Tax=Cognatilysobacter tabacisoli TaxID=2315424 RepID=UPI000E6B04AA|nr:histidine kinase [Lysobacter tabacisoli]
MSTTTRTLLSPLNFAGYLAWAGIGWELLFSRWDPPDWLAGREPPTPLLAALLLAFLAMFMLTTGTERPNAHKRALVLAQAVIAFALMAMARSSTLPILLLLVLVQAVHLWSTRALVVGFVLGNVLAYGVYQYVWDLNSPWVSTLMQMSFQGFAALTAWFAFRAEATRDELAAVNADLRATRELLAESSRESERLRLSRELHDVAGHKLTALKLNLGALQRDPRHVGDAQVALCARLADELLADIRGVVEQMRHDDGLELGPALAALAAPFPRPALQLQVDADARAGSLAQAEAVLRTVQEGLVNAARHSQAQTLWVVLRRDGGELRLDIRDDGRAGGALQPGNGLRGMRERLEGVGGGLDVRRTDTGGVHLRAWLPAAAA